MSTDDKPCDAACGCVPAEFVRPRFYFGQRLGVVDLCDWLWYHAGKQRFHNLRLHGAGVLCGLRAERYEIPGQDTTTVLRLRRGAALDACGREIVVGCDQCIDVAAWFLQQRESEAVKAWLEGDDRHLCIGLRYLECPSDPSPAPRDPCGCDAGGCEYGRVREGFELRLFTPAEMQAILATSPPPAPFPAPADLDALLAKLAGSSGDADQVAEQLQQALNLAVAADCPVPPEETWLWLACFEVELDGDPPRLIDIVPDSVDNGIPERVSLLSTSALQYLLGKALQASLEPPLIAQPVDDHPKWDHLAFQGSGATAGMLTLSIELAWAAVAGHHALPVPLETGTFDPAYVQVRRLGPAGWQDATPPSADIRYNAGASQPQLEVKWASGLKKGRYRLTVAPPVQTPIVDKNMQALPLPLVRHFQLEDQGGTLIFTESAS